MTEAHIDCTSLEGASPAAQEDVHSVLDRSPDADSVRVAPITAPVAQARPRASARRQPAQGPGAPEWRDRMTVSYHDVDLLHVLKPGGVVQRHLIVHSAKIRQVLGQPHRRALPVLRARQEHFELSTSELWEQAQYEAEPIVRRVYSEFRNRLQQTLQPRASRRVARALGTVVDAVDSKQETRGILLHQQDGPDGDYELYLWDPDKAQMLRVAAPDLKRALESSQSQLFDTIQVIPREVLKVPIEEERSGIFGDERRPLRHKRQLFDVHRTAAAPKVTFRPSSRS